MDNNQFIFIVHHEKGGKMQVFADSKEDAIEKYWQALESILGHQEGCCSCFKNPKPFDRSKWVQPVKVDGPFLGFTKLKSELCEVKND